MLIHPNDAPVLEFINSNWKHGPWIAGGAPLAWYNGEQITSDIDVYFKDENSFDEMQKSLNLGDTDESMVGKVTLGKIGLTDVHVIFISKNAITVRYKEKWTIQFIKHSLYNTPQDIINNFDISVCQIVTNGVNDIHCGKNTLRDIHTKTLRIENYRPECISRLVKYMAYGYKPVKGTLDNILNIPGFNKKFKPGTEDYDY